MKVDYHPSMRRLHKPDLNLDAKQQEERSFAILEAPTMETWLKGTIAEVSTLTAITPV
jgi:hypothetical protein